MKIIVYGATGAMGRKLLTLAENNTDVEVSAKVSPEYSGCENGCYAEVSDVLESADVLVDFSFHGAIGEIMAYCVEHHVPAVIATTGHTEEEKQIICNAAQSIPVFYSSNMSIGVAVTCQLAKQAAAAFRDADIEIVETHHNRKIDAPSGTALMIADALKEIRPDAVVTTGRSGHAKREKNEIGIQSVRLGNVVGIHEILISNGNETLTIKHEAHDRALFAQGALEAARFVIGKQAGLYDMKSLMSREEKE
ncbi:MAG: 4-hydroxy-tetrahydrodipicolinate reductase [Bulleidia sp.]